jgi:tetratricopeptide (TPR) repeat protein
MLLIQGLFAAAALSYKIAQTLNSNNALIATNIGAFLVTNQKGNESFRFFQHAMQIDSINPCIYMNMGLAYMSIHRLEDAEKLLKESAYCYGSSAGIACARNGAFEPFYNLAVLEQRKGNLDEALKFINSAALECSSELHFQLVDNLLGFLKACMCDWSGCYKTLYVIGILKNQFEKSFDTSAHITAHRETEVICNADIGHDKESLRSSYGISDDLFLFGCFQSPQYICPKLFDVWLHILKETNGTSFLLLRHNEQMETNLKSEAQRNGVDPNRLIFVNYVSHHEHLKRYSMIDIYLDTFMRSGRVSICETLLSGSPAICIPGESPCTLYGSKILKSVGLDGMIVQSLEEYRNLAISLQSDQEKFIEIIRKLDEKVSVADSNFPKCRWVYCIEKGLRQS